LFYSLKPNFRGNWQGGFVTTNSLGLRSAEITSKKPGEFRILSLGESSTFGARVNDEETYSAQLEQILNQKHPEHVFRVINGGVSGYSSFQSLKYLETRGLDLELDLVLFYHEVNDAQLVEFTDNELFQSRTQAWHRHLADWSALYRMLANAQAKRRISAMRNAQEADADDSAEKRPRVSPEEREENFARLETRCRENGVRLVMIHPAYAGTRPHTCELTEFCRRSGVPMHEAYDDLHPKGAEQRDLFADEIHPNAQGHQRLAEGLAKFLEQENLLP
jgi:lysophospholipase L1-like esterase